MPAVRTKPLKEDQITNLMNHLKDSRDYNLLAITGLLMKATRIADVINTVKISDIYSESGKLREQLEYSEAKTGKKRIIPLKGVLLTLALKQLYKQLKNKDRNKPLFYSQKGKFSGVPINTVTVNRQLKKFIGMFGIEAISSHAIRKTACRLMYERGIDITTVAEVCNHASSAVTRRYICVNSEDVSNALTVLEF